ncbi:hypothetical protein ACHQM5_026932 [Ranunculus cassubicifolius]
MEKQTQPSGICHRLFNFLIEGVLLKRVTLGRSIENDNPNSHKSTEESNVHNLAYGRRQESLVERANKLNNTFPISTIGSPIHVEKGFEVDSQSLRMIPCKGEDGIQPKVQPKKVAFHPSPKVGGDLRKKKGKKVMMKEKMMPAENPENDVKVRPTTPVIPIISSAFNIDERSDELIRRTREALRNSAKHS